MAAVSAIPAFFSQYYVIDNKCEPQIQGDVTVHVHVYFTACLSKVFIVVTPKILCVYLPLAYSIYKLHVIFFPDEITQRYISRLHDPLETTRMGFAQAIGAFPKAFVAGNLSTVFTALIAASKIQAKYVKMAEARRDAVKALARCASYLPLFCSILMCLHLCSFNRLQDYCCLLKFNLILLHVFKPECVRCSYVVVEHYLYVKHVHSDVRVYECQRGIVTV